MVSADQKGFQVKTIIMCDPMPEVPGSRFPRVSINAFEAEKEAAKLGARLPTSEEYDRLFAEWPWPHLLYEWTSTDVGAARSLRGGAWFDRPSDARAANRFWSVPAERLDFIGFRCAKDVPDDAEVPEGWVVLP